MNAAVAVPHLNMPSVTRGSQTYAHVVHIGAQPTQPVEVHLGAPEDAFDMDAAAGALMDASDVEENTSSSVVLGSPFGI